MTQMRYTRQLAMSTRQAYTFQYDNNNKRIQIIGPIAPGTIALADANYPNNTGSSALLTVPLTQTGLPTTELNEGIPSTSTGLPAGASTPPNSLGDRVVKSALTNGNLNITFQPDGTLIEWRDGAIKDSISWVRSYPCITQPRQWARTMRTPRITEPQQGTGLST
jgi:hypothetical protein